MQNILNAYDNNFIDNNLLKLNPINEYVLANDFQKIFENIYKNKILVTNFCNKYFPHNGSCSLICFVSPLYYAFLINQYLIMNIYIQLTNNETNCDSVVSFLNDTIIDKRIIPQKIYTSTFMNFSKIKTVIMSKYQQKQKSNINYLTILQNFNFNFLHNIKNHKTSDINFIDEYFINCKIIEFLIKIQYYEIFINKVEITDFGYFYNDELLDFNIKHANELNLITFIMYNYNDKYIFSKCLEIIKSQHNVYISSYDDMVYKMLELKNYINIELFLIFLDFEQIGQQTTIKMILNILNKSDDIPEQILYNLLSIFETKNSLFITSTIINKLLLLNCSYKVINEKIQKKLINIEHFDIVFREQKESEYCTLRSIVGDDWIYDNSDTLLDIFLNYANNLNIFINLFKYNLKVDTIRKIIKNKRFEYIKYVFQNINTFDFDTDYSEKDNNGKDIIDYVIDYLPIDYVYDTCYYKINKINKMFYLKILNLPQCEPLLERIFKLGNILNDNNHTIYINDTNNFFYNMLASKYIVNKYKLFSLLLDKNNYYEIEKYFTKPFIVICLENKQFDPNYNIVKLMLEHILLLNNINISVGTIINNSNNSNNIERNLKIDSKVNTYLNLIINTIKNNTNFNENYKYISCYIMMIYQLTLSIIKKTVIKKTHINLNDDIFIKKK